MIKRIDNFIIKFGAGILVALCLIAAVSSVISVVVALDSEHKAQHALALEAEANQDAISIDGHQIRGLEAQIQALAKELVALRHQHPPATGIGTLPKPPNGVTGTKPHTGTSGAVVTPTQSPHPTPTVTSTPTPTGGIIPPICVPVTGCI